ncbi:transmembrane protein, putative (macronuclear) [Tetrahymena thermophila SB210]|uniref:Transmembrane protein, putative n=1 Tax=Tetrahymena thermophila (strain SB210) TaxID=312017 RepID=Q23R76_TETTS|nr:transmembrane protein, putative [Tetrahymena thermophila SB210]EAR99172.2 transmembrane protein, putative [Tetrahymena thermophila SB210]|eukprot:XP_001019417.2 transmembrane protein, putative [Tetrahymena thermophila SB210]
MDTNLQQLQNDRTSLNNSRVSNAERNQIKIADNDEQNKSLNVRTHKKRLDITSHNLETDNLQEDQISPKKPSDSIPQTIVNTEAPQLVAVKASSNKKKIWIGLGVFFVIAILVGGIVAYTQVNKSGKSGSGSTPFVPVIQVPANYAKFQSSIDQGQEKNLVKIIQVPETLKYYDYTLNNEQTTTGGDGKAKVSISTIIHRIGLFCSSVDDHEFDMYLFFKETTMKDDGKITNTYQGFPGMLNLNSNNSTGRFLKKDEQVSQQNSEFLASSSIQSLANEYNPLTQNEIELLKKKGISVEQYLTSSYPIIRFKLGKDGSILRIYLPINMRYDLLQVYLNVMEQIAPIVNSENYKINQKDSNGKSRVLEAKNQFFQRILDEVVPADMEATVDENGQGLLKKSFNQDKQSSGSGKESLSYTQNSKIQNGALLESNVNSGFSMSDNKSSTSQDDMSVIKGIDLKSDCSIKFAEMIENVPQEQINQIISTQTKMSTWDYTLQQAQDAHAAMFKKSQASGIPEDNEDDQPKGRFLAADKVIGDTIYKPIYRKNFASMEFGADLKSECVESGMIGEDDICTVGLYSFFNNSTQKLVEKKTRLNVSRILKYYQYIQHILTFKMDEAKTIVSTKLNKINDSLNGVLDQLEMLIDVQQNPVIKDIYNAINNDELQIISTIQNFEKLINLSLKNIGELIKDPLNTLKERTFSFLAEKQINIETQINSIQNFYVNKLLKIKDFVMKAKKDGIDEKTYKKIKNILENIDGVIVQLVDKPAKQLLEKAEVMINEQASKIFAHNSELDKKVNSLTDSVTQQVPAQLKKMLGSGFLADQLQSFVQKGIQEVVQKVNITDILSTQFKKVVGGIKNEILNQMDTIAKKNDATVDADIRQLLDEATQVYTFSADLYSGFLQLKDDVKTIVEQLKKLQSENVYKVLLDLTKSLTGFPTDLAQKLLDQGKSTAAKVVEISKNMKANVIKYQQDITSKSLQLLNDMKDIYKEVKAFLNKRDFPEDTAEYYSTPLFDEVSTIIQNATQIFNINYSNITNTYERFKQVPNKFQKFITDLKNLGDRSMDYFNQVKISFQNIKTDSKLFWNELVAKYAQVTNKRMLQKGTPQLPGMVNDIRQKIADSVKSYTSNLSTLFDENFKNDILTKVQDTVSKSVKTVVEDKLNQAKEGNFQGLLDVQNLYQSLIAELVKNFEFEKNLVFPPVKLPVEYTYVYPTPIGVTLKLKIYASWDTNIRFNALFKNAILDLGASVSTKVNVGGEVSASVVVAEVGGYCEGTFLDTTLTAGINVQVLKNFEGNLFVDAQFSPYDIRLGLYYSTIFSKQTVQCAKDVVNGKRVLGALDKVTDFVKSNVGAIANSSDNPVVKKVTDTASCVQGTVSQPQRNNIFEPLALKGETYKKRLVDISIRRSSNNDQKKRREL